MSSFILMSYRRIGQCVGGFQAKEVETPALFS